MKKIISILLLLVSFSAFSQIKIGGVSKSNFELNYTDPQKYEIGGITVSGVEFLDESALISLSGLKIGDNVTIPGDDISKAIKMLWDQGILGNIELQVTKVEGDFVFLNFKLEEKPRLTKFAFEGVRKSEADDLREKIRLIRGRTVTDAVLNSTEQKVKKYYVQKGFRNSEVSVIQKKDSILPNSVILVIKVDKREKVKIEDVVIKGNTAFTTKKLQRKMKDTKVAKSHRIFKTSKALPGAIARDKQNIIDLYNSSGYRDAKIASDTIYNVSEERVIIGLTIDEGPQYYFGDITWSGNFVYDDDVLSKVLAINKGAIYDKDLMDKRLNFNPSGRDVTSLYMDDGYLFFNIQPVEVNVNGDSIDIEMRIYEGEQATIDKIIVNGNTKTSDHVIRRELRTLPGQKFSRTNLIRTQRELSQLGYFDPATMGINPIPHPEDGTVDIEYDVTEKANDQFTLSGGWGGFYGFVGTVGLVFNNFAASKLFKPKEYDPLPGGNGQRVAVNMQANGSNYQSYNFSFTEPWLGGKKPNALTVSLRHSITRSGLFTGQPDSIKDLVPKLKITGLTVYLGRRLQVPDDYFNLSNSVSLMRYNLFNYGTYFPIDSGNAYNFSFNNTISRYSVGNRPEFPTYGSSFSLSTSITPPYSLLDKVENYNDLEVEDKFKFAEYHKWMFDATWYNSLIKGKKQDYNLVLKTSFHAGFVGTYNNKLGYSPFERFVMGGSGISGIGGSNFLLGYENIALRGYDDSAPLRGDDFGGSGGTKFTKFVAELRYPISLNPMATIYPIAFFEMGNNWNEFNNTDFFNLYRSTGIGVRINMPMFGLIGFDYGFAIDGPASQMDFLKRGQFHFMIGQQIR